MINNNVRYLYTLLDGFFGGVLGFILLDVIQTTGTLLQEVDGWFKIAASVVGLAYFGAMFPHRKTMRRLDKEFKIEELRKLKSQNDEYEELYKKNKR